MISMIDRFPARLRAGPMLGLVLVAVGVLVAGLFFWVNYSGAVTAPETVAQQYLVSLYAQDYERAYELISTTDKSYKSRDEYLRENNPFTGFTLEAARHLATYIEFSETQLEQLGENRLSVMLKFVMPDGNAEVVREILFARPQSGNELPEAEREALLAKLDQLHENGQIATFEGEQTFELVKEEAGWRIQENWAASVRVHFSGEVKEGLLWEFEPLQEVVLAKPGETLQTTYRAKNLSDQPVVALARHLDRPEEYLDYLNIIQCFCFIQQTLRAGEEVKLPLAFRVEWDVPDEVRDFYVHYEFYPIESFPDE